MPEAARELVIPRTFFYPIYAREGELYTGGRFLQKIYLDPKEDTLRWLLGFHSYIRATRKLKAFHIQKRWRKYHTHYTWTLSIRNLSQDSVTIETVVPLPAAPYPISIQLESEPPPQQTTSRHALWTIHLPPNQHYTLTYSIHIQCPKDYAPCLLEYTELSR